MSRDSDKFKSHFGRIKRIVTFVVMTSLILLFALNYDVIIHVGVSKSYFENSLGIPSYLSRNFTGYDNGRNNKKQRTFFKETDAHCGVIR